MMLDQKKRTLNTVSAVLFTALVILLSLLFMRFEWNRFNQTASNEAVQLAQSLEPLFYPEHVAQLTGNAGDIQKPEYFMAKRSLIRLAQTNTLIHSAYLMREKDGEVVFLVDSKSPDSAEYAPPGQVYEEADRLTRKPFDSGMAVLTQPSEDRWGTWVSALVPIRESSGGTNLAVFGIDFSASQWNAAIWRQMIPSIVVVLVFMMLCFALFRIYIQQSKLKKLYQKVFTDEALFRGIFQQTPYGVAIMQDLAHAGTRVFGDLSINPMYEKILGRSNEELGKLTWAEITHPDDLDADLLQFDRLRKGEITSYSMEKRLMKPDGSYVWVQMMISPLYNLLSENTLHLCLLNEMNQRKQTEGLLKESERKQTVLLSHLPGLAYRSQYSREGTLLYVSEGCFDLTGYQPEALLNNKDLSINDLITPEYKEQVWKEWQRTVPYRQPYQCEYEITTASGQRKWVLEIGQGIYNDQGEVEALEGILLDISDRKEFENNLRYMNTHDHSTGLFNRSYLEILLENDSERKDLKKRALIGINLSTVHLLTANYGFIYTQNLIKKAAEDLSRYCTDSCMLFQTFDNRFVFYLKEYIDQDELLVFSKTIGNTLEAIFMTERINGGIGILEIDPEYEESTDSLLRKLLIASEASLKNDENKFQAIFYDEKLEALINRGNNISQALSSILKDDREDDFYLQYQPIVNLETNAICCFEALARLRIDKLGQISPLEFIPIAEQTKVIIPLGEKVIQYAFRFLNQLDALGYGAISVSVNVSAIQLLKVDFSDRLFDMIREFSVDSNRIGIEITESVFASDFDTINNTIKRFRDAGIQVSIDDFGTGYSSLARESSLFVNGLKIDKSFIDELMLVSLEKAITGDIISMAHKLGHYTIAEGVEHEKQLHYLIEHGCDMAQGYLISKPLDKEDAIKFLQNFPGISR